MISSPTALYRLNSRWGIPNQYRQVRSECVEVSPGRLRISISIPRSYRGSIAVFHASIGILRGLPKIIGMPESEVLSRELSTHGMTAVIKPPPARTLVSYARHLARRVRGLESMLDSLARAVRKQRDDHSFSQLKSS